MAAFLHAPEEGGRFTDHRLGAWYASTTVETAIAETLYHHERRLRASAAGFPARIQMRELVAVLDSEFLDLRAQQAVHSSLYHPTDYTASQAFAATHRWPFAAQPEEGIIYDSVRRAGGVNICVWRPLSIPLPVEQGTHYEYVWDVGGAATVLELRNVAL